MSANFFAEKLTYIRAIFLLFTILLLIKVDILIYIC